MMMMTETEQVNEELLSCSQDDVTTCPLFMQSLPTDFASNPALAALASLIDDDEPPVSYVVVTSPPSAVLPAGGGKARVPKSRTRRRSEPYPTKPANDNKPTTTIGEAQLFLSLWKL